MLKFKNGKFKIMQIADTQETINVSPDTVRLIETALDKEKPDLVIFTGDQLKGYAGEYRKGNITENVKKSLDSQINPIVKRGIPFAVTFGNHDEQAGISEKEQFEIYKSYKTNVSVDNDEGLSGCGTYNLPIYNDSGEVKFNLYIINSYGFTGTVGKYSTVSKEQLDWFRSKRDELKKQNEGYVPSLLFQHIPVPEIGYFIKRIKGYKKGAIHGYRKFKGYYVLDKEKCFDGNALFGETPGSPDENVGEFDVVREKGDVLGMYFGHDHRNSYAGRCKNIDLGYAPGAGFNIYGPGIDRAVRMFEIDEINPEIYSTYTVSYRELCGKKTIKPFANFLYNIEPANIADGINLGLKLLGSIALIILIIIFLCKL